jgi:Domain of unknown function (DUF4157)
MLYLQHAIGNQAVLRLLRAKPGEFDAGSDAIATPRFAYDFAEIPAYAKAKVTDTYEQEAYRVADQVMQKDRREPLQTKPVRKGDASETTVPPIVQEVISCHGPPLDSTTREWMRSRFGHDFSTVRVHTDARAAESARALGARAYTVGSELVFDAGQYAPGTAEGRRLLAHELTHVMQQRSSSSPRIQRQPQDVRSKSGSKRVPPGPGERTPKEYEAWAKAHPKREYRVGGPWEPDALYARYTPQWFWGHGYIYAGRGGNVPLYWFEVWIDERGAGQEFRVWRDPDFRAKTGAASQKAPPVEADYIDPNADRKALFGSIIAARERVDAAFGEGNVVLYEDATAELFLEGTTQSYVFRPVPGGGYVVYGPNGRRLEKIYMIPEQDIPDVEDDAVEQ